MGLLDVRPVELFMRETESGSPCAPNIERCGVTRFVRSAPSRSASQAVAPPRNHARHRKSKGDSSSPAHLSASLASVCSKTVSMTTPSSSPSLLKGFVNYTNNQSSVVGEAGQPLVAHIRFGVRSRARFFSRGGFRVKNMFHSKIENKRLSRRLAKKTKVALYRRIGR